MQKQLIVQLWVLLKLTDVKSLSYIQRHDADLILTMLSVVLCECIVVPLARFDCISPCCHSLVCCKSLRLKKQQLLCAQTSAHAEFCCGDLGSRTISYDAIALCHMCARVCFLRLVGVRVCEPLSCQAWQHLLSSPALQDDLITFTLSPLTAFDRHFARLKLGVKSQSRVKRHVTVSEEWKAPIVN